MQVIRLLTVLTCAVAVAGSATAPQARKVKTQATMSASVDQTWEALIDLFSESNWPITNMERASGLITTDWISLGSEAGRFADCGSSLAFVDGTFVRFNVRVRARGEGSSLMVGASFRQQRSFDGQRATVDCVSKGAVERLIHGTIAERTENMPTPDPPVSKPVRERPPRGYYCATSVVTQGAGLCTRGKSACVRARDAVAAMVTDMSECGLVEVAWCYSDDDDVDHCYPDQAVCAEQQQRMAALDECGERK